MNKIFLFFYNIFENYIHLKRVKSFLSKNISLHDPIIFDVGSHKGKLAGLMNDLYNNALVYCFEPNEQLHKNIKAKNKLLFIFFTTYNCLSKFKFLNTLFH